MSRSDQNMDEVLRKIEELSAGLEPPEGPSNNANEQNDKAVELPTEAFEEIEKQSTETTNVLITNQGLLESILVEIQDTHRTLKDLLG